MENNYQRKEQQGRSLFSAWANQNYHNVHIWDINFTAGQYDSTDVNFFSGATTFTGEIKTRDYQHKHYSSGWIFEKRKFDELKVIQASANTHSVYINIFQDALVIWDLTAVESLPWEYKLCWENHECKRKVWKWVCYLSIEKAAHIFKNKFEFRNRPCKGHIGK